MVNLDCTRDMIYEAGLLQYIIGTEYKGAAVASTGLHNRDDPSKACDAGVLGEDVREGRSQWDTGQGSDGQCFVSPDTHRILRNRALGVGRDATTVHGTTLAQSVVNDWIMAHAHEHDPAESNLTGSCSLVTQCDGSWI
ncbi:hypothetical protein J6590_029902 [Homalodisca vitripennis]|nr:hypothetical protein J6590_029902 [Homalodisca vitripennis]